MISIFKSSLIRYACGLTLIGFLYNDRIPDEGNDMAITLSKTDKGKPSLFNESQLFDNLILKFIIFITVMCASFHHLETNSINLTYEVLPQFIHVI